MLKQKIQIDTKESMKGGDSFTTGVLRMLSAAIITKEKDKKFKEKLEENIELSNEEIIDVISSEVKKRKDAITLYEKGNRPELAENEKKEIEVLKKYLPEQLSEQELKKIIEASIAKVGAKEIKDTGKIMTDLMPQVKGKAEGSEISRIIKELLNK